MKKIRKHSRSVKRKRNRKRRSVYRVKNWTAYNAALVQRGDVTIWFSEDAIAHWNYTGPRQRGGVIIYSDLAIETALSLRLIYHLGFRQTEGFLASVVKLLGLLLDIPDYSTLSRRQGVLSIRLAPHKPTEPLHVVVDSTGLKVYGEGEWKVRQHGWSQRRTWRKLHLAVEVTSGVIVAAELTTNSIADDEQVPSLLEQIEAPIARFGGDGSYDKWHVYEYLADPPFQDEPIKPIIPPRKDAKITQHGNCKAPPLPRDEAIRTIRQHGRKAWKRYSSYHRRSLDETTISRYKRIIGTHVRTRTLTNQQTEARLGCKVLNRMTDLGTPESYLVQTGS